MHIVTGSAGFIGSNLVAHLNKQGHEDILLVDNLSMDKTKNLEKGAPIPVVITAYKDRSFDFVTKLPPVSYYLKKAAKIKKGNSTPGRSLVGKVTSSDIEKIAKEKMQDLNAIDLNGAINMVKGSAVSMGMEVVN